MFSQVCVKNSVHRGEGVSQHALEQTPPCPVHAEIPPRADTPLGQTHPPGRQPPLPMDNAADGMHPTGMHSCCIVNL